MEIVATTVKLIAEERLKLMKFNPSYILNIDEAYRKDGGKENLKASGYLVGYIDVLSGFCVIF